MPLEVWNPRWSRSLQRLFNSKGAAGGPLSVLGDVMPTSPIIDATQNEHHFYRGENPWAVSSSISAVAGQYGQVLLQASPGWLVVIETISLGGASAAFSVLAMLGTQGGAAAPATPPVSLDRRLANVPGLLFDTSTNAVAPAGDELGRWYLPALSPSTVVYAGEQAAIIHNPEGAVVVGKACFMLKGATVNVGCNFVLSGYSRPLDVGELNL